LSWFVCLVLDDDNTLLDLVSSSAAIRSNVGQYGVWEGIFDFVVSGVISGPNTEPTITNSPKAMTKLTIWSRMAKMRNVMSASEIGAVQEGGNNSTPTLRLAHTRGVQGTKLIPRSDNDDDDFVEVMSINVSSSWSTYGSKIDDDDWTNTSGSQITTHLVHRQRRR
jgi:hypothetical protein